MARTSVLDSVEGGLTEATFELVGQALTLLPHIGLSRLAQRETMEVIAHRRVLEGAYLHRIDWDVRLTGVARHLTGHRESRNCRYEQHQKHAFGMDPE